ncbi:MAG TPA: nucleotidyltransferase domain-containing protein, partial [Candidatus Thermoplasmatota archaeon]|nr:nucleotidyltransferase domain-containing protein [Candidatus Thermoplasmatota archaeon]
MPYSRHDTPEVVRRIEADLQAVTSSLRKADPHVRALVLTGGFARGEGTVLAGEPQNDYDFVALRGVGPPRVPYEALRHRLEARLGLHVDLAPVPVWRLRWTAPSIFWYETALRGRTLWGEELLHKVPTRTPQAIHPGEGLRLLVNRAAGLLLCTEERDAHKVRIQAAK